MEFEKARMHFLSEPFPAVAVVIAYVPSALRILTYDEKS